MTPEAKTRIEIDKKLTASGYVIQDMKEFNPTAALGVAVREFPTNSGPVDYLIFIDKTPVGVIEAKATDKGEKLIGVAEQSKRYAESGLKYIKNIPSIRFAYESTDVITYFCDYNDEKYRSREVFAFHKPETLKAWLKENDTLRNRLKSIPPFDDNGFRKCQTDAIVKLEQSFANNRPRALIQMATGAGKTFTAITSVYRLLKFHKAKRILFLVDTKNLGEQAETEFMKYVPNDDTKIFTENYNVCRLKNANIPSNTHVCISTIQRMYSILRGEELSEYDEETSLNEVKLTGKNKEVAYNTKYPPEYFDFIVIDECHRSIYNIWQQVLDYFDAFLIGLTATPDERTFGFFNENVVSEYTHEQAVIDDVNVGLDGTYLIETDITQKGGVILKQTIQKRERLSRKKRWELLDEDVNYVPTQLDKDVVNPSQIRNVIRAFKDSLFKEIFIGRKEVPKTLFFAKTDSHADDIIKIIREEFNEGNEFCKKITYGSEEDPKSILSAFRNDYNPRIAVTVDMIATGTDVKPIECLVFMRDVRSKNYFEQMKGRATRTLNHEDLKRVTPSATERKLGYVLVDAVGVTKTVKTVSRQLERNPAVSLKELMMSVVLGADDEDTLTSLSNRLLKLDKVLTNKEKEKASELSGNLSLTTIAKNMLDAFDEDVIAQQAQEVCDNPTDDQIAETQETLVKTAIEPIYSPEFREFILNARKSHDQIIDTINLDKVNFMGWNEDREQKAEATINTFRAFIDENQDKIAALSIIYNQSYKNRQLTFEMIEELYEELKKPPYKLSNNLLWVAYCIKDGNKVKKRVEDKLADIVTLIRYELGQTSELNLFSAEVNIKFRDWVFKKNAGHVQFTEEQMAWLRMIKEHIAISAHIETDDLEYTPFDSKGGLGKFYQLFGEDYETILEEMNYELVA